MALTCVSTACGGSKPPASPSKIEKQVTCFRGTTEMLNPNGDKQDTKFARVKRTVDATSKTIEELVEVASTGDFVAQDTKTFDVVFTVSADKESKYTFTMAEKSGAFTGQGVLNGEPWKWNSWNSTSTMGPIAVESSDEMNGTGMTATKSIRRAGALLASTKENYSVIPCW
jgi:hypothetical protein